MADKDSLAWHGRARPRVAGGFVSGVGLNERTHALAVDPDGVAPEVIDEGAGPAGPKLSLDRMNDDAPDRVQRNGRVRLTRS